VQPALQRAQELFEKRLREPAQNAAARARLRADVAGEGVPDADIVIEAIFESSRPSSSCMRSSSHA